MTELHLCMLSQNESKCIFCRMGIYEQEWMGFQCQACSCQLLEAYFKFGVILLKEEFIGPGLHLRPVHADHARPPLQWTLNSVIVAMEMTTER